MSAWLLEEVLAKVNQLFEGEDFTVGEQQYVNRVGLWLAMQSERPDPISRAAAD